MAELVLKSERFREEREADWRRLEALLKRAESGGPRGLSLEEMLELPRLYRAALSSLSMAQAISLDRALIDYLEALCARAYFFVYGERTPLSDRIRRFFRVDWPVSAGSLWRELVVAAGLMSAAALAAGLLSAADADWFYSFIPEPLASGRTPAASTEELRTTLFGGRDDDRALGVFSTFLFTHNAQVSLTAFALGFAFGLPTALLMMYNGAILGAFLALFISRGLGVELGGWLSIHGTTELLAIALAGAAGFRIGSSIAFPGARSRLASAVAAGRSVAPAMVGVVLMLFIAAVLEGVGRQLIEWTPARYAVGAAALALWLAYFFRPRTGPAP